MSQCKHYGLWTGKRCENEVGIAGNTYCREHGPSERTYTAAEVAELKAQCAAMLEEVSARFRDWAEGTGPTDRLIGYERCAEYCAGRIPADHAAALAEVKRQARLEFVTPELIEQIHAAVAQGWCVPPNTAKTMDCDLALAIVNNVLAALRAEGAVDTEPEPIKQVQTSGPQCKRCGAFTTYARVKSHGLCMKCENVEGAKPDKPVGDWARQGLRRGDPAK